jgi:hypothetical protein
VDLGDKTIDLSVLSRVTKFNNTLQRTCLVDCEWTGGSHLCRIDLSVGSLDRLHTLLCPKMAV